MSLRHTHVRPSNLTGILAMLGSMAFFVANDTCVKLVGETVPLGELILLRNTAATAYILAFAAIVGGLRLPKDAPRRLLGWRMAAEAIATLAFLTALIAMPIAGVTALAQFTPLAITAAAAIFLKEHIGWRGWLATLVGLLGVMLIARPGTSAFSPATPVLLVSVALVAARDLMTRQIPGNVPTLTLTLMSAAVTAPAGLLLAPFETWVMPGLREVLLLMLGGAFLTVGYALIIVAMRAGDVGTVAPFRYAVILFALLSGWVVWNETPDGVQIIGIAILTLAGLYSVQNERRSLKLPAG